MTIDYKSYFAETQPTSKYWGKEGAGVIFVSKDTGRLLLAHRSAEVNFEPETWGTWGGKLDNDETPKQTVEREVQEETGFNGKYKIHHLWDFHDPETNFKYHNYLVVVDFEFTPQLNWENDNSKWVKYGEWPEPLHWGLELLIQNAGHKIQKLLSLIDKKKLNEAAHPPPVSVKHNVIPTPPPAHVQKATKVFSPNVVNISNAYIVAATLWGEARQDGEIGMQAVMNVIMNRAKGDFNKASGVVLKPKQFSMWNNIEDPEKAALNLARVIRTKAPADSATYMKAIEIVDKAAKGKLLDITGGATSYVNLKKANPSWARTLTKTKEIGHHTFYKKPAKIAESISSKSLGIEDVDTVGYEINSPHSYLRYAYNQNTNTFYLRNIGTPNPNDKHKGYAKELLDVFLRLIKARNGALDPGTYTVSGNAYIKHVVERLAKVYNVRLVYDKA